jgi:hypothetical protein
MSNELGLRAVMHTDFDTAVELVTKALQAEQFGVITTIDMQVCLRCARHAMC